MNFNIKTSLLLTTLMLTSNCGDSQEQQNSEEQDQSYQSIQLEDSGVTTNDDIIFVEAAKNGEFRAVRAMMDQERANLTSTNQEGISALMAASLAGHEDTVEVLLERISKGDAVRLDLGDQKGNTALTYAVIGKNPDIITLLREHGANPNVFNNNREFPIHIAVNNNDFKSAQALVDKISGAAKTNLNASNIDGKTAMHLAAKNANEAFLRFLKNAGADINPQDRDQLTPLSQAIEDKQDAIIDLLISLGADINYPNSYGETALSYAIEIGNYPLANKLLSKGANPNANASGKMTILQAAVSKENANLETIKALIAAGAVLENEEMPEKTSLAYSLVAGNAEIMQLLMDSGASIEKLEKQNSNALITALNTKDEELATMAFKNGAKLNLLDDNGYSPLALAIRNEYNKLAIAMLEKGADLGLRTGNDAAVPLEIIFQGSNAEVLEYTIKAKLISDISNLVLRSIAERKVAILDTILKHGANPNISDSSGQPAIWLATAQNQPDMVKLLHKAGAEIDITDQNKQATPLLISIISKSQPLMNYYISQGANINAQDSKGLGVLAYAILTKQPQLVEPLLKAGARTDLKDFNGNDLTAVVQQSELSDKDKEKLLTLLQKY